MRHPGLSVFLDSADFYECIVAVSQRRCKRPEARLGESTAFANPVVSD